MPQPRPPKASKCSKVGILTACGLHSLGQGMVATLLQDVITSDQFAVYTDNLPLDLLPGDWWTGGMVCGCLIGLLMVVKLGSRPTVQLYTLPLLLVTTMFLYFLPELPPDTAAQSEVSLTIWVIVFIICLVIQGWCEAVSELAIAVYCLKTVGYRGGSHACALITAIYLPRALSGFTYAILYPPLLRVTPVLILMLAWFLYTPLPDTKKSSELATISSWPPQVVQYDDGWVRPLLVSCGILLLSQFTGTQAYRYYSTWSFRYAGLDWEELITHGCWAGGAGLCLLTSLICGWRAVRLSTWSGAALMTTCLFSSGLVLYRGSSPSWLPLVLYLVHGISNSVSLGSLAIPLAVDLTPSSYSPQVLSISLLLRNTVSRLNVRALPILLESLHPFGVFWLYSSLTAVGLLYLASVVGPEMAFATEKRKRRRFRKPTTDRSVGPPFQSTTKDP